MERLYSLAENPHSWVYLGFFIFILVVGPKIWKALSSMLDQQALKIKADLDLAQKLRDEAEALLKEYRRKQQDATKESTAILQSAKELAAIQVAEAKQHLQESLNRREKLAMEKIEQAERQAMLAVRKEAVDVATRAAERLIAEAMNEERAKAITDKAIADLSRSAH